MKKTDPNAENFKALFLAHIQKRLKEGSLDKKTGNALVIESQVKFLKDRRFIGDLVIRSARMVVELDGGVFTNGRHTRGKGYTLDRERDLAAAEAAWITVRLTTGQITEENAKRVVDVELSRITIDRPDGTAIVIHQGF